MIAVRPRPRASLSRLPDLSHHAINVWRRNRDVNLKLWKTELFLPLIEPLLVLLAMGLGLGGFINLGGPHAYVRYLAPGVLAQFPMFQATFECCWGAYWRMEDHGTYSAIAATPASLDDVVCGDLLWAATRSLINSVYIVAVLVAFTPAYGIVQSPTVLLAIPVAFLLGLCIGGFAMCFTAVAPAISFLGYLFNIAILPMFWLSGTFFPIERLPGWVQVIAWLMPMTDVISINRHLMEGTPRWQDLLHLAMLGGEAVLFGCIAMALVRRRLIK